MFWDECSSHGSVSFESICCYSLKYTRVSFIVMNSNAFTVWTAVLWHHSDADKISGCRRFTAERRRRLYITHYRDVVVFMTSGFRYTDTRVLIPQGWVLQLILSTHSQTELNLILTSLTALQIDVMWSIELDWIVHQFLCNAKLKY